MAPSSEQFVHESPYFPVLGGLLFVAFWLLINLLVSRVGWHAFAAQHPAPTRPPGGTWASPFTSFGLLRSHYTYCVRVVFCDAGIYFSTSLLARAFHAPFLVPWASLKRVEAKTGLLPRYRLEIEDAAGEIHVTLAAKAKHELLRYRKAA
jgi:hypothetical protein